MRTVRVASQSWRRRYLCAVGLRSEDVVVRRWVTTPVQEIDRTRYCHAIQTGHSARNHALTATNSLDSSRIYLLTGASLEQ